MKMKNRKKRIWPVLALLALIVPLNFGSCDGGGIGGNGPDSGPGGPIDTSALDVILAEAQAMLNNLIITGNGNGVPNDVYWVAPAAAAQLQIAIGLGNSVLDDPRPTEAQVREVIYLIEERMLLIDGLAQTGNAPFSGAALLDKINAARALIAAADIIPDATIDAPAGVRWTPTVVANALIAVITAQNNALMNASNQAALDSGVNALIEAIAAFEAGGRVGPGETRFVTAGLGFSGNSTNNVAFRQSAMVTFIHPDTGRQMQLTSYFVDAHTATHAFLAFGIRYMHEPTYRRIMSDISGRVNNAHNSPSMIVCGLGYIHIAINDHNMPLQYFRGPRPGVPPMAADRRFMIGPTHGNAAHNENSVTYVEFYKMQNTGNVLFFHRNGGAGTGYLVVNRWIADAANPRWERMHTRLLCGTTVATATGGTFSPYWQVFLDETDRMHISWTFRTHPGVQSNRNKYYAFSDDEGVTWRRHSDGSEYALPIGPFDSLNAAQRAELAWPIPHYANLMNQTNMTGEGGRPFILTYFSYPFPTGAGGTPSGTIQYWVIFNERQPGTAENPHTGDHLGRGWRKTQVSSRTNDDNAVRAGVNPLLWGGGTITSPLSRPRMVVRRVGNRVEGFFIARFQDSAAITEVGWAPTYNQRRVSLLYTANILDGMNATWNHRYLTDFSVNFWEPSMDTCLWKEEGRLHIFVQNNRGSVDGVTDNTPIPLGVHPPTQVYTLIVDTNLFN